MAVDFRLYLITDRKAAKHPLPEAVRLALEGGVRAVQLREKDLPVRELLSLAQELRGITREFGAKLFINDRVDVALLAEADGLHLGRQSMPADVVRKVVGPGMLIGVSTHSLMEAREAQQQGADFITFGPVFATPSKAQYGPPAGVEALRALREHLVIPCFALGGIQNGNLRRVFGAGCHGVAMISWILAAEDVRAAARRVLDGIGLIEQIICQECGRR